MGQYNSREELEHLIVIRHKEGWSIRKLSRDLGVSRNTVSGILKKICRQREQGHDILANTHRAPRPSKLDEYIPKIKELLEQYPNAKGQRVFEEIQAAGYQGGISILREKLQTIRPKPKRKPIIRFETNPGKQGQMDWSPYTLKLADGGKLKVLCFSYVLGFSRRHYIDFVLHRDFFTLIRRHQDAFSHFGGVPEQCLYDSEKTVVLRWEANKPIYNPAFLRFITHYDCRPIACARGRPETKGKVEAPFQFIEGNLLNARTFVGLEDLRATARWWLKNRSDPHIHDTTHRAPLELFLAEEAHRLQPLPRHPYDSAQVVFRVCGLDGFVEWSGNLYSVPFEHVGEIMTVKATDFEVIVYSPDIELVTRHERLADSAHKKQELPEHRVGAKQVRYGLEPVRETFLALGDATDDFLGGLKKKHPRNCGFHVRRILLQKKTYHCQDIHRALVHAMRYHAYDCQAVERILQARAKPRTLEECIIQKTSGQLRGALPPIEQRSLSEYQNLLHHHEAEALVSQEDGNDPTEQST